MTSPTRSRPGLAPTSEPALGPPPTTGAGAPRTAGAAAVEGAGPAGAHPVWALALVGLGYAGYVKGLPALAGLRLDLTGLFAAVVAAAVLWQAAHRRGVPRAALLVVGLWLTFAVGAAGGLWYESGPYKVALLFSVTLLCALAPAWLLSTEQSRRWLVPLVVVAGLAMAAALMLNPDREVESLYGRLTLEGSNSIGTARVVGAGAAVALVRGLAGGRGRWWWLGVAGLMAAVLVLVGSRGPFVGLVAAVVVALLLGKTGRGVRRLWISLLGLLAVLSLLLVVATSQNRAAGRIAGLVTGASTDETRLALVRQCAATVAHHVLGIGWGGFSSVALQGALQGRYSYPHNMVLEILAEGGWLAGAAFLAVVVVALLGFWRCSGTAEGATLFTMGVYWVMVAQTSGDINANRMTWVVLGLGIVLHVSGGPRPWTWGRRPGRRPGFLPRGARRPAGRPRGGQLTSSRAHRTVRPSSRAKWTTNVADAPTAAPVEPPCTAPMTIPATVTTMTTSPTRPTKRSSPRPWRKLVSSEMAKAKTSPAQTMRSGSTALA